MSNHQVIDSVGKIYLDHKHLKINNQTKFRVILISVLTISLCHLCNAQDYFLKNEQILYSFSTVDGKKMILAKDTSDKYIIYRYGTVDKIEFEFPEKTKESWKHFTYSFYLRGGGKQNEGMDLNYVYFINGNFKYVIYNTYSTVEEKSKCGIKVINLSTKKIQDIKGNVNTAKGNLIDFRDNVLLKIGDELFD